VRMKNGAEFRGTAYLLRASLNPGETPEISALAIHCQESLPVLRLVNEEWNGFKVNGSLKLNFGFTITPDKSALALEAMKRLAPQLLRAGAGTVAKGAAEVLASGPALVGMLGGYVTIKATLASLADWKDMKDAASAAERAVQGYAGGFSAAVGGKSVAGDAKFFQQGRADGARMLGDASEETRRTLTARLQQNASAVYDAIYSSTAPSIKEAFVERWKANLTGFQKTFTKTESDERRLRTRMGLKDRAPSAAAAAPEPPAETTVPTEARMQAEEQQVQLLATLCRANRNVETALFGSIEADIGNAIRSIERLNALARFQATWNSQVDQLVALATRLGKDPAPFDALRPDRARRDRLNQKVVGGHGHGL
jgi:hypothetical protein